MLFAVGVGDATSSLLVCLLTGSCYGTGFSVFPTYLGDLFGVMNVHTLVGALGLVVGGLFASIDPVLYGCIRNVTDSYDAVFLIAGTLCLVSAVSLFLIKVPVKKKALPSSSLLSSPSRYNGRQDGCSPSPLGSTPNLTLTGFYFERVGGT